MQIAQRCYAVTGLAYGPPWSVNAGFVVGAHTTLVIDTGANASAAATIHGYAIAVRPDNRLIAINTEKHFDHIGGNGWLRARGADVYGHPGIARTEDEWAAEIAEFNSLIPNPARRGRNEARVFYHGTTFANPTRQVTEPAAFDLGSCTAQVIATPGHTPTNISVWIPEDRVLYCGDCLTNGYLPNLDASSPAEWPGWLESVDRVEALQPAAIVCGHGPVAIGDEVGRLINGVRDALKDSICRHEANV